MPLGFSPTSNACIYLTGYKQDKHHCQGTYRIASQRLNCVSLLVSSTMKSGFFAFLRFAAFSFIFFATEEDRFEVPLAVNLALSILESIGPAFAPLDLNRICDMERTILL